MLLPSVDGEHYAPVVRDALAALPYEVVALWLAGGSEKLRGGEDYGVPVVDALEAAIAELEPEVVVDLSDEPVLGPRERFRVASRVLARGLPYVGPDFRFDPPPLAPFPRPSLAIVGTGKRVGKTAVTGHVARLLARDRDVVVVAMGRGGPPEPEVAEVQPTLELLLELSRAGRHAASDYLENAALAGVVTIGCRRCGGGLAGAPGETNVPAGAALAAERGPDLVIFDGSGAAIPPVETDARVLVASTRQPVEVVTGYLNAYRILVSDLVLVTGGLDEELVEAIRRVKELPVVSVELRPRPVAPVLGRRVAFFTTAPPRRTRRSSGTCARSSAPRSCSSPATSPAATRCARTSRARRGRRLPRRDQGGRDRRRRRGGARARGGGRVRRQRARPRRRARPRQRAGPARRPGDRARGGGPVTDRRHRRPLPLGGEDGLPYSKGLMARALTGDRRLDRARVRAGAAAEADLAHSGRESISFERLDELAREMLGEEDGATTMRRLRRYQELHELDLPIILLVGGATGTGKSTVATEVAYRLGITRVTSTDFIRQTMRAFFSREFMPSIHYSSFEAGRAIADADAEGERAVLDGFLEQTRNVLVGVQAAIERALEEGWSMVLEGVHLVPGMLPREIEGALVVQCVLAIETRRCTRATSRSATPTPRACGRREVPRRLRRHPADPGLHRRPAREARGARDRERQHRGRDRRGDGARAARGRAGRGAPVTRRSPRRAATRSGTRRASASARATRA